jgi:Zn-dependent protease
VSHYYESEIEVKVWEMERYGFKPGNYFRKPVPIGAFIPILTALISFGYFTWLAALIFDVKPRVYRAAKRHGLYSFSEMTEEHLGNIAVAGIVANLVFAVIGYLIGFEEFAKLSIYYAAFSIIPISDLDGNKIFFGNVILWSFLAALLAIVVGFVMFIV